MVVENQMTHHKVLKQLVVMKVVENNWMTHQKESKQLVVMKVVEHSIMITQRGLLSKTIAQNMYIWSLFNIYIVNT